MTTEEKSDIMYALELGINKMRWNDTPPIEEQAWQRWFAWHPVYINVWPNKGAWLEVIERKKTYGNYSKNDYIWIYRYIEDKK